MKRLVSSSRFVLFSLVGIVLIVFGVWIWDGGRSVVHEPVHGTKDVDVMKLEDRIGSSEGLESELSAAAPKSKNAAVENREETEMMKEDHSAHVKRSQKMSQGTSLQLLWKTLNEGVISRKKFSTNTMPGLFRFIGDQRIWKNI